MQTTMLEYEERIRQDWDWGMAEGDRHFRREGELFKALRKIAKRLDDLGIPSAVVGGMSVFTYGYRRLTGDVDLLVNSEGLGIIHKKLDGDGYLPAFTRSRSLRDAENGVLIKFLISGQFPGDGKPKPVAFPDPADVAVTIDGIRYIALPTLVELKLASGMTGGVHRLKDFADVVALIKDANLPSSLVDELNPYVHEKYSELWTGVHDTPDPMADGHTFD
jgi:hypothetical protein